MPDIKRKPSSVRAETISPDFANEKADIQLLSTDDVLFYVESFYLRANR